MRDDTLTLCHTMHAAWCLHVLIVLVQMPGAHHSLSCAVICTAAVQMVVACRVLAAEPGEDKAAVTNVVFMGMGGEHQLRMHAAFSMHRQLTGCVLSWLPSSLLWRCLLQQGIG